jgi:hypothetical protein
VIADVGQRLVQLAGHRTRCLATVARVIDRPQNLAP